MPLVFSFRYSVHDNVLQILLMEQQQRHTVIMNIQRTLDWENEKKKTVREQERKERKKSEEKYLIV